MSALERLARSSTGCVLATLLTLGAGADPEPGLLRIGTSGDYAPFSERDPGSASGLRGFDISVARAFAAQTGREPRFVAFRWPALATAWQADRFDVAMSGVTVRPERSIAGRFTVPVARTGAMLIVREADAQAASGDPSALLRELDAPARRIAVNAGGHLERVTRALFRSARVQAIPDNAAVPRALAAGEVDAVVTDSLEAPHWLASLSGVRAVGPFTRDWKAYWVAPDDADLARSLDAWLLDREADGSLGRLRAPWLSGVEMPATASPHSALLAASDERLALMPFVAGFKRAHGLAVVDPAREEKVLDAGWRAVLRAARARGVDPPDADAVRAFYRAQIDAAVEVQERTLAGDRDPALERFDLATQLRPALLRIGDRMAFLIVAAARSGASEPGDTDLLEALAAHELSPARRAAIADAMARLAYPARE